MANQPSLPGRAGPPASARPREGPPRTSPAVGPGASSPGRPRGPGPSKAPETARLALIFAVGLLLLVVGSLALVLVVTRTEEKPVPAVVGQQLNQALAALTGEGLDVAVRRTANVAAKDRVLGQSPDGGTKSDDDSTVSIVVSAGPGKGTVPDVSELTEPRAQAALRTAGLVVRPRQEFSRGVAEGTAIRTLPAAGARLDKGSRISLVVSRGPQTVAVPEVVGDAEGAAKESVKQAGLRIEITQRRSNLSPGDVVSQSPRPRSVVVRGSVVEVEVDKEPSPVEVPNVQGKPVADAVGSLSDLGLAVFFRPAEAKDQRQGDKVVRQQPAPGAKAQPGSRVVLQVAPSGSASAP